MKVKLFTHTDLDGVGCAIVGRWAFDVVDVTYCDYDKIDQKVASLINSGDYQSYDRIYITDISVNEEVAELIEQICPNKVILLDHHATASWLNKYAWATVSPIKVVEIPDGYFAPPEGITVRTAGTSMFYDHVTEAGYFKDYEDTRWFVENVRRWDTWDWFNVHKDELPKRLNNLLYLIGRERFAERFTSSANLQFHTSEKLILELEEEKISKYIEKVSKNILRTKFGEYENVGIVFAENYTSELGNTICNNNPDLDFVMIVNVGGSSISFRGIKDEIDLGVIAKKFGGGGHPKAAGAKLNKAIKELITLNVLVQGGLS